MTLNVRIGGPPTAEVLRTLLDDARAQGDERLSVETAPESGDAWAAARFKEVARVFSISVEELERLLTAREPAMLRRLARELSDRLGAVVVLLGVEHEAVVRFVLFERGRVMDEYASVPGFHGPVAPGDAVALAANPTVVARLTGAAPGHVR